MRGHQRVHAPLGGASGRHRVAREREAFTLSSTWGMEVTTRKRSDEALAVMASKLVRIALTCSPRIVRVPRFTFASPQAPMKILFVIPARCSTRMFSFGLNH